MSNHMTHEKLPEGFHYADRHQIDSFMASGSINGASKVCLVAGAGELPRLATRLRPTGMASYDIDYRLGWQSAKQTQRGYRTRTIAGDSEAFWAGYRDRMEGRMKWHLAHCPDHGDHEGGCQR